MRGIFCTHLGEIGVEAAALQAENQNIVVLKSLPPLSFPGKLLWGREWGKQQVPVAGYCAWDNFCFISDSCAVMQNAKKWSRDLKRTVNRELLWWC